MNRNLDLRIAIENGSLADARELLALGANPKALAGDGGFRKGMTLLMTAARGGRYDILRTLLAAGADPRARDSFGHTALMHAAQCVDPDALLCARALLPLSDADAQSTTGETALWLAVSMEHSSWALKHKLASGEALDARAALMVQEIMPWAMDFTTRDQVGRQDAMALAAKLDRPLTVLALLKMPKKELARASVAYAAEEAVTLGSTQALGALLAALSEQEKKRVFNRTLNRWKPQGSSGLVVSRSFKGLDLLAQDLGGKDAARAIELFGAKNLPRAAAWSERSELEEAVAEGRRALAKSLAEEAGGATKADAQTACAAQSPRPNLAPSGAHSAPRMGAERGSLGRPPKAGRSPDAAPNQSTQKRPAAGALRPWAQSGAKRAETSDSARKPNRL